MLPLHWPAVLLCALFAPALSAASLQVPPNIEARRVLLYALSNTTMPNQIFMIPFNVSFSTMSTFAFGMNQYKMGDQFFTEDFKASQTGLNNSTVNITVTSVGNTNPRLFSISLIAAQNVPSLFSRPLIQTSVPFPRLRPPTSHQGPAFAR
jgi:hypothetical protein